MHMLGHTKLMLLLFSKTNPFWAELIKPEITTKKICDYAGVGATTFAYWKKSHRIELQTVDNCIAEIKMRLNNTKDDKSFLSVSPDIKQRRLETLDAFYKLYTSDGKDRVPKARKIFGMTRDQAGQAIDEAVYSQTPVFPEMYGHVPGHDNVLDEYIENYRGVYFMLIKRRTFWLQCALQVRYILKIGANLAIRCKVNLPKIDAREDEAERWEYDGWMVGRENNIFWMFETRQKKRNDYFYFVTDNGRLYEDKLTLLGRYLTTDQDRTQTIVSDQLLLQRIELSDELAIEDFMRSSAKIISEESRTAEIDELWQKASAER